MVNRFLDFIEKHLFLSLIIVAGLRLLFLAASDFDLLGDESYYWDWSRHPDICYYSKPPMVAWLIGLVTFLFGDSAFVVRLPAVILGSIFLYYFHATTQFYYGSRNAALALLLILATPINLLANFLMTIDPPLYCFWIISLFYLSRAIFASDQSAWLKAGLASAAALMSKQVALLLPGLALVFILLSPGYRHLIYRFFTQYSVPVILAGGLIVFWNSQHAWIMFGHSQEHFVEHTGETWLKHLQHARDFWFYQLLLMTPPVFVLVLVTAIAMLFGFKQLNAEQRFLWLTGPSLLLGILVASFMRKMQGNWPMPFYFTALILLVGRWSFDDWPRVWKWILGLGFSLVLITSFLPLLIGVSGLKGSQWDPTHRFKSWQPIAEQVDVIRQTVQTDLPNTFVVTVGHRNLASQLAFYLHDHPAVFRYEPSGQVLSQYEVWGGPTQRIGQSAFLIGELTESELPEELKKAFNSVRLIGQVNDPNRKNAVFYIFFADKLLHWPVFEPQAGKVNDYE